jgi:hypothetical protein
VHLRVTQHDAFDGTLDVQRQHGGVESFLAQVEQDFVVIDIDQQRRADPP